MQFNCINIISQQMVKYSVIPLQKRKEFINAVVVQKKGLTKMARKYRIKVSTAKSMLRVYRKTGKILQKKEKVKKIKLKNEDQILSQKKVIANKEQEQAKQVEVKVQNKQQQYFCQNMMNRNNFQCQQFNTQQLPKYCTMSGSFDPNYHHFFWPPHGFN